MELTENQILLLDVIREGGTTFYRANPDIIVLERNGLISSDVGSEHKAEYTITTAGIDALKHINPWR